MASDGCELLCSGVVIGIDVDVGVEIDVKVDVNVDDTDAVDDAVDGTVDDAVNDAVTDFPIPAGAQMGPSTAGFRQSSGTQLPCRSSAVGHASYFFWQHHSIK